MSRKRPLQRVSTKRAAVAVVVIVGAIAVVASLTDAVGASAPHAGPSRAAIAQHLQKTVGRFMTGPAESALAMAATGTRQFGRSGALASSSEVAQAPARAVRSAGLAPTTPGLANVRVNDPGEDTQFIDQTTQSETAIGVAGQNVVVGFNDSQTTGVFLTAGSNLTGYSYSSDGGTTFTDAGALPNAPEFVNFGDPWLGSDRAGNFYYSELMANGFNGNLDVGVAKSTDGGQTFSAPKVVDPSANDFFYFGDKDALAVGPDPTNHAHDDVYVAWDDSFLDQDFNSFNGLPVARSTDGGQTWHVTYADQIPQDNTGCSFGQYIGSTPSVAPNGTLYVVAEKISVDDPNCQFPPLTFSEWVFKSTDGGQTFDSGHQLATVTEGGDLDLGPGMVMRNLEFPAIDVAPNGTVYVAWNDSSSGHSNIRLATSTNSGGTWTLSWATSGANDKVQPALSADGGGLHIAYYQRNPNNTLDVFVGNSTDGGKHFATKRVTSQSFPGVFTAPQFDPIIAFGYMGDYIANVSDGTDQYFAWGDNRDTVTNILWPKGRHDPNVYFAKQ